MIINLFNSFNTLSILFSLIIISPLLLTTLLLLTRKKPNLRDSISVIIPTLCLLLNILLYLKYSNGQQVNFNFITIDLQFYTFNISLYLEKFSLIFALLVNFLWIITTIYTIGYLRAEKSKFQTRFFIFLHLSIIVTFCIAYSANVLTIFFFYELLTLTTLPLIAHSLNKSIMRNFNLYVGVLVFTSFLFFLPAVVMLYLLFGTSAFLDGGLFIYKPLNYTFVILISLLLFIFGISKTGIMPVHKWLPAAMIAPTPVSALLHAVAVVNSGAFVLFKIVVFIYGITFLQGIKIISPAIDLLIWIPCITIIWASVIALFQDNLKTRLAYSTISQLSYIVLAILLFSDISTLAAMLHIIAHSFSKITMFFAAGALIAITHKHNVSELDGIGKKMPIAMIAFSIGALSLIGLPLTAGFTSKWFLLRSIIETKHYIILLVIIISTILNSLYLLPIIFRAFFKTSLNKHIYKQSVTMNIALVTTATGVILLYLYSNNLIQFLLN